VIGDRLRLLQSLERRNPDIEDAIEGGEPGEKAAIWADLGRDLAWIAEEKRTRNQMLAHLDVIRSSIAGRGLKSA
jgi:hypothetical protein